MRRTQTLPAAGSPKPGSLSRERHTCRRRLPRIAAATSGKVKAGLISSERQPKLAELLANFGEGGHAEVFGFEKLVGGPLDEVAHGVDAQAVHALAGADGQVE